MSLKTVVSRKVLDEILNGCTIELVSNNNAHALKMNWKVLVVDHKTMRIISSCCKLHDVAGEGVLLVENIMLKRQPFTKFESVYLLTPSEDSIHGLIADFGERAMYRSAHVFFTEVCPESLFKKLGQSKAAKYIKTIKEMEFGFLPYESQVFTLDNPSVFKSYYNENESCDLGRMAEEITTLCAALGEYPYVRYSLFGNVEKNSRLAELVQSNLELYKDEICVEMAGIKSGSEKSRSQLLILDRSFDVVSPLLHELTFQAMAYDLLDIRNDIYVDESEREVTLDESNELWAELRHKNIGVASQHISREIKEFRSKKKELNSVAGGGNVKELTKMINQVPQYQKDLKKYSTNFKLAEDCLKLQEKVRLLCKIEQDIAMGTNEEGESIKDYISVLNPVLLDSYAGVSEMEKLRVLILYILNQNGVSDALLTKLLQHANITHLRPLIMNLDKLGLNVLSDIRTQSRITQVPRKHRRMETFNVLSRWTPTVKELMEEVIDDTLDRRNFPFVAGRAPVPGQKSHPISARYGHWHSDKSGSGKEQPRLIVFIVGGITYSEMRAAYEVTESGKNWEVIIGSTHTIVPNSFLDQLRDL